MVPTRIWCGQLKFQCRVVRFFTPIILLSFITVQVTPVPLYAQNQEDPAVSFSTGVAAPAVSLETVITADAEAPILDIHQIFFQSDANPLSPATRDENPVIKEDEGLSSQEIRTALEITESPNDPLYETYQWWLRQVDADDAWAFTKGEGVTVAVLDTGLDLDHPDIMDNVWVNDTEMNGRVGVDDDGNGYVDDIHGWDFYYNDNNPTDQHGHGSHVAGIIGAVDDNGLGIAGIAPEATIMPIQVLSSSGAGLESAVIKGIRYAVDMGAKIISMSLGGFFSSGSSFVTQLRDAVQYALSQNVVVVAAAGNSSADMTNFYPAATPDVIAVGATDSTDYRAWFSNYGQALDIVAPGVGIMSLNQSGGYTQFSGTSMAAPVVSGVLALLFAANPFLSVPNAVRRLLYSAQDLGLSGKDIYYGYGLVNAFRTLSYDYYDIGKIKTQWFPQPDFEDRTRVEYDLEGYSYSPNGRIIQEHFADGHWVVTDYWPGTLVPKKKSFYLPDGKLEKTLRFDINGDPAKKTPVVVDIKRILTVNQTGQVTKYEEDITDDNGNFLYLLRRESIRYDKISGAITAYKESFIFPDETKFTGSYKNSTYIFQGNLINPYTGNQKVRRYFSLTPSQNFILDPQGAKDILIDDNFYAGFGAAPSVEGDFTSRRYFESYNSGKQLTGFEDWVFSSASGEYLYKRIRKSIRRDTDTNSLLSYTETVQFSGGQKIKIQFSASVGGFTISGTLNDGTDLPEVFIPETAESFDPFYDATNQWFYFYALLGGQNTFYNLQGQKII